jgi:energy-coupling factor transporter ATP-binding protein EcfA2
LSFPSWRLTLRVIAVLSWLVSVLWLIVDPGFEPLVAFLGGTAVFLGSFAVSDAPIIHVRDYSPTPEQQQRNRRLMLERVESFWVKGVLEQSLYGAALVELGLEERQEAVENPWRMMLQTLDQPNRLLPADTKIVDVFDEVGQGLLILGEPGSGKTTTLLHLARETIARAEKDSTQSIPVVFNLSSWAEKRPSIAEWLVEELGTQYDIPKKVSRPWVENDELLLLFDGLDEVAQEHREDCVKAINNFRQENLVSLVVCSRSEEYEALATKLRLQGAVCLQPLTPQQVDQYLAGAGLEFQAVRGTLQHDTTFQELSRSPLMLSIMTLAYKGYSAQDLQPLATVEARRKHLFDAYVGQMLKRRSTDQQYSSMGCLLGCFVG